ncbi:hypothetical protein [Hymenobacter bucti]|uniref:Uncharacterized protein n=1 Tax=Hymenobacter bucti TaxID=1844114 RepID=A0ABW4R2M3_9BACT
MSHKAQSGAEWAFFTLAVAELGHHTKQASGLLCTAILGEAVMPMLFGLVAGHNGLRWRYCWRCSATPTSCGTAC